MTSSSTQDYQAEATHKGAPGPSAAARANRQMKHLLLGQRTPPGDVARHCPEPTHRKTYRNWASAAGVLLLGAVLGSAGMLAVKFSLGSQTVAEGIALSEQQDIRSQQDGMTIVKRRVTEGLTAARALAAIDTPGDGQDSGTALLRYTAANALQMLRESGHEDDARLVIRMFSPPK